MNITSLLIAVLVAVGIYGGGYFHGRADGGNAVQVKWDAEKQAAEAQAENNRLLRQAAVNQTSRQFAEQAAKDRVVTRTIIKEVEKYVPSTLTLLPGDFRVFHDAAAAGEEIDDTRRADAAPVAPRTVAVTLAENYASSNYDKQRLEALQEIVRASGCFDTHH